MNSNIRRHLESGLCHGKAIAYVVDGSTTWNAYLAAGVFDAAFSTAAAGGAADEALLQSYGAPYEWPQAITTACDAYEAAFANKTPPSATASPKTPNSTTQCPK